MSKLFQRLCTLLALAGLALPGCAQRPAPEDRPALSHPEYDERLRSLLRFDVPLMGVRELQALQAKGQAPLLLDTREREEYEVSCIPGARWVGYDDFELARVADADKARPVVLYCSVGYRSEHIARRLREAGFGQVYNLYGSIFEWANQGYPLATPQGEPTRRVHTYNRAWGKWVQPGKAEKVW